MTKTRTISSSSAGVMVFAESDKPDRSSHTARQSLPDALSNRIQGSSESTSSTYLHTMDWDPHHKLTLFDIPKSLLASLSSFLAQRCLLFPLATSTPS